MRKALSIEPKFWNAGFNLAEIAFLKKDWVEARNRFEVLIARENEGMQSEMSQLISTKFCSPSCSREGEHGRLDPEPVRAREG